MTDLKNTWVLGEQYAHTDQNAIATAVNANTHTRPASGLFSALPAAGNAGSLYECTDAGLLLIDNGTSWDRYGGQLNHFTAPPSSGLTNTTMGTATFSADKDSRLLTLPSTSNTTWRVEYATLSPTTNYTATAYVEVATSGNFIDSGIVLLDGSLKIIHFGMSTNVVGQAPQLASGKCNSPTSFNSFYATTSQSLLMGTPHWVRVRDDGSSRFFEYSLNGTDWTIQSSSANTDFLTPSAIGWGGSSITSSGTPSKLRLRSFNITSP